MFLLCLDTTPDQERAFFEQLYLKYHRLMYKTASTYVTDQPDIEDVLQDAIERLLVRTPKLMRIPCCALPTYLVYTVRSTAINFKRHQSVIAKHTVFIISGEENTRRQNYEDTPQQILEAKEHLQKIRDIWRNLPDSDQELLYRRYVLEQTDTELADIFHCKPGSIRVKLTRARRRASNLLSRGEE